MPKPANFQHFGVLQRKCGCEGPGSTFGECAECKAERGAPLQRKSAGAREQDRKPDEIPPIVHEVLRSPGQPLDAATRAFMEPRFGHDFSGVRVHADDRAAAAAASINARAFTSNQNVVFGSNQYAPHTDSGRFLLSHELTHVLQQRVNVPNERIEQAYHAYEQRADDVARRVLQNQFVANSLSRSQGQEPVGIQRKVVDQDGNEIKINLENVKPGDSVTPEFFKGVRKRVRNETTKIINAMLKTPSGLEALKKWIELPGAIKLQYTEDSLYDDGGEETHGGSSGSDPNAPAGTTEVIVSNASVTKENDRYRHLEGEQLWGAIAVHESVHQSKENLLAQQKLTSLQSEIDAAGGKIGKKDPRLTERKELKKQIEVEPVQRELTSLIEYDVLYPEKAGKWRTKNFEDFLGKEIYKQTVRSALGGLVRGGYIDAEHENKLLKMYLEHHKPQAKKSKGK